MAFADGTLDVEARKNAHNRNENFKNHLATAACCLFWLAVALLFAFGIVWAYHMITPTNWHFLDAQQIGAIQGMLFSGVISSLTSSFAEKYIKK
jgi:nitrate reductase NapE component